MGIRDMNKQGGYGVVLPLTEHGANRQDDAADIAISLGASEPSKE